MMRLKIFVIKCLVIGMGLRIRLSRLRRNFCWVCYCILRKTKGLQILSDLLVLMMTDTTKKCSATTSS